MEASRGTEKQASTRASKLESLALKTREISCFLFASFFLSNVFAGEKKSRILWGSASLASCTTPIISDLAVLGRAFSLGSFLESPQRPPCLAPQHH